MEIGRASARGLATALAAVVPLLAGSAACEDPELASIEQQVFAAVNDYRRSEGLAPLERDDRIEVAARRHSRAMAAGRVPVGHDGFRDRADELKRRLPLASMAENVYRLDRPRSDVVEAALAGWLRSKVHRRNIRSDSRKTGVGAALGSDGSFFLTQIFVGVRGD